MRSSLKVPSNRRPPVLELCRDRLMRRRLLSLFSHILTGRRMSQSIRRIHLDVVQQESSFLRLAAKVTRLHELCLLSVAVVYYWWPRGLISTWQYAFLNVGSSGSLHAPVALCSSTYVLET